MSNVYYSGWCKIHDEHEPYEHDEYLWTCPKCSKKGASLDEIVKVLEKIKLDTDS